MISTTVLWVLQYRRTRQLELEVWQSWKEYLSKESAQIGLEHHRTTFPSTEWRLVKETVTVEEVVEDAVGVEE